MRKPRLSYFSGKHNTAVEAAGVCRVKLVRDRNKTDIVGMEILFDIITGINGIPPQPGEVLDNHTVNMARLNIGIASVWKPGRWKFVPVAPLSI